MPESETDQDQQDELDTLKSALAEHQRREAELLVLHETVLDLQHLRDPDELVREIVKRARRFVGSDFCYLSTRDDDRGDYAARSHDNAITSHFETLRMEASQGVLGHVVATSAPFFTTHYATDRRFAHDPLVDLAMEREGITSMLGVPLLLAGRTLGVFFVADRRTRSYLPGEISMLSALASHAALALENARLLAEARDANAQIEYQRRATAVAAAAHEQMTDLVARGGSVEALAELLAGQLSSTVTVLDAASRSMSVQHPAGAIREEQPPSSMIRAALTESRRVARSVEIMDWPEFRIVAVAGGGEVLGGLMLGKNGGLSQVEVRILERAASVMGIVLMSQERVTQRAHREVNELLAALLNAETIEHSLQADAVRLGLRIATHPQLLVLEGPNARTVQGLEEAGRLLRGAASLVGNYDGRVVAFINSENPRALGERLLERLHAMGIEETTVAISRSFHSFDAVKAAHRTCGQLLKLGAKLSTAGALLLEEQLGLYAMLFEGQNAVQIEGFVSACIGAVIARDRQAGSMLVETMLTYLDHGHNVRAAAQALDVHMNTVRQRLETIGSLVPGWSDPARVLEVHAALRLSRLMRP